MVASTPALASDIWFGTALNVSHDQFIEARLNIEGCQDDFVVDTSILGFLYLNQSFFKHLEKNKTSEGNALGKDKDGRKYETSFVTYQNIAINGVNIKTVTASPVRDLFYRQARSHRPLLGKQVVRLDYFTNFQRVKFDLPNRQVEISDANPPLTFGPDPQYEFPLIKQKSSIFIEVQKAQDSALFFLDSTAKRSFISSDKAKTLQLGKHCRNATEKVAWCTVTGLFKPNGSDADYRLAVHNQSTIANHLLGNFQFYSDIGADGVLGIDFFQTHSLLSNLTENKAWIWPM